LPDGGGGGEPAPRRPSALGRPRVHLRETGSTNDRARELALAGAPDGTLVTASAQSAGRGRQGRRWSAPPNSALLMSLLLRSPPPLLPLIAAVAVCDVAGEEARVKWPNDIVLVRDASATADAGAGARAGRGTDDDAMAGAEAIDAEPSPADTGAPVLLAKLAGILIEGRPQAGWAVLGIGLNVAVRLEELPLELRPVAATLGLEPDAIEPTLERLLAALAARLEAPTAEILDAWRARDALYGLEISWGSGDGRGGRGGRGRGRARGIDGAGRLIVALDDGGDIALDAGEVHLVPVG
jgi:BirA family transcriptional regulator, biotin operon repressor / biotin---[acetyl-CoA-carboxylase] ligase